MFLRRESFGAWFGHLWRFVLVGSSGAVIDFAVYLALTRTSDFWYRHFVLASTLSSLLAATNNFWWNRQWTFRGTAGRVGWQYTGYLMVTAVYIGFIQFGLWYTVQFWHWHDFWAKVTVLAVAVSLYFSVVRQGIFGVSRQFDRLDSSN